MKLRKSLLMLQVNNLKGFLKYKKAKFLFNYHIFFLKNQLNAVLLSFFSCQLITPVNILHPSTYAFNLYICISLYIY